MKKTRSLRRPEVRRHSWNDAPFRSLRRLGLLDRSLRLEPLEQRCLLTVDFGDAPQYYPTLLSENGARHDEIGPTLGATRSLHAIALTTEPQPELWPLPATHAAWPGSLT